MVKDEYTVPNKRPKMKYELALKEFAKSSTTHLFLQDPVDPVGHPEHNLFEFHVTDQKPIQFFFSGCVPCKETFHTFDHHILEVFFIWKRWKQLELNDLIRHFLLLISLENPYGIFKEIKSIRHKEFATNGIS